MRTRAERRQEFAGILLDLVHGQHDQRLTGDVLDRDDVGADERMADRQPQAVWRGFEDFRLQPMRSRRFEMTITATSSSPPIRRCSR